MPNNLAKLPVLVVEDVALLQKLMKTLLTQAGCAVDLADNGRSALDLFQQQHHPLVLLDWKLPDMDGIEVAKRLRELEQSSAAIAQSRSYIVALTAHDSADHRQNCLQNGMDDFWVKPLTDAKIKELIQIVTEQSKKQFIREIT